MIQQHRWYMTDIWTRPIPSAPPFVRENNTRRASANVGRKMARTVPPSANCTQISKRTQVPHTFDMWYFLNVLVFFFLPFLRFSRVSFRMTVLPLQYWFVHENATFLSIRCASLVLILSSTAILLPISLTTNSTSTSSFPICDVHLRNKTFELSKQQKNKNDKHV